MHHLGAVLAQHGPQLRTASGHGDHTRDLEHPLDTVRVVRDQVHQQSLRTAVVVLAAVHDPHYQFVLPLHAHGCQAAEGSVAGEVGSERPVAGKEEAAVTMEQPAPLGGTEHRVDEHGVPVRSVLDDPRHVVVVHGLQCAQRRGDLRALVAVRGHAPRGLVVDGRPQRERLGVLLEQDRLR